MDLNTRMGKKPNDSSKFPVHQDDMANDEQRKDTTYYNKKTVKSGLFNRLMSQNTNTSQLSAGNDEEQQVSVKAKHKKNPIIAFFIHLLSFGANQQQKELKNIVEQIDDVSDRFESMSDEELVGITAYFRERHERGETLDELLPEAFAAVREASERALGMRHFPVQLMGGVALHRGMIAEMKTGEGKTLVAPLAAYLNAIPGRGVHVVTVNEYLAHRDSEWMGGVYSRLGMTVGLLLNGMDPVERRNAYLADVTYGTNSEFGFDYLRDNMVTRADQRVQRGHAFAIVDEADSILIDEARTPLIISGAGKSSADTYKDFAQAVHGLKSDIDFDMDEAKHTIAATESGLHKIEGRLKEKLSYDSIYSDPSGQLVNHLQQALKAEYLFHRDRQYIVSDGEVKIVDEFTGRVLEGRRYSEGLHQAIEAKEHVSVKEENQTLATITLQNYFRLYKKLSGMTGTAMTEDAEFREVYGLPVQTIEPNRPVIRDDHDDLVYSNVDTKFEAVAKDIAKRNRKGQPVLVGTVSIESSERLSKLLKEKYNIEHVVLNARKLAPGEHKETSQYEEEAFVVANAGRPGAVTIATNMAGRGTDILLGGNIGELAWEDLYSGEEPDETDVQRALEKHREKWEKNHASVVANGGLYVIGTERHESRRIDNQLRGRSGRQGDPGETQFYLSLEDDLMRLFGGDRMDRIAAMMARYDMPADMPIQSRLVSRAVEGAQRKVEEMNFAMRKQVLEYDDVMNEQRRVIYEERNKILDMDAKALLGHVRDVTQDVVHRRTEEFCPKRRDPEDWDVESLRGWVAELTGRDELPELDDDLDQTDVIELVGHFVSDCYSKKSDQLPDGVMQALSAQVMLRVIDAQWMSYLQEMDYLRAGIGLRGFGQRDPLVEYKAEAYAAFTKLVNTMYEDFLRTILRIELAPAGQARALKSEGDNALRGAKYSGPAEVDGDQGSGRMSARLAPKGAGTAQAQTTAPVPSAPSKPTTYRKADSSDPYANVGRNDPCPCGSGKKFKNCHGKNRGGGAR